MKDVKNHPVIQFYISNNHFGALLGMDFDVDLPGKVTYRMVVEQRHLAVPTAAHGGSICSLMDATLGVCALSEVVREGFVVSTIEMKISFISPGMLGDTLTGKGTIIKRRKRLLFVEGEIRNQKNELIAAASGTFNAYPAKKAGLIE